MSRPARQFAATIGSAILLLVLLAGAGPRQQWAGRALAALAGTCIVAVLAWRWRRDRVPPARWTAGDALLAALAALLFAAATGAGPG